MAGVFSSFLFALVLLAGCLAEVEPQQKTHGLRVVAISSRQADQLLDELKKDVEEMDLLENSSDDGRASRALLKKLSFLAGLKLGTIFQSSGTLAASNSIRIFGKIMNSALSISYGSTSEAVEPLPIVNNPSVTSIHPRNPQVQDEQETTTFPPSDLIKNQFIRNHNQYVQRVNQKLWKDRVTGRSSS